MRSSEPRIGFLRVPSCNAPEPLVRTSGRLVSAGTPVASLPMPDRFAPELRVLRFRASWIRSPCSRALSCTAP
eukprot:9825840-Alexandrium_andersonii.AAC.1